MNQEEQFLLEAFREKMKDIREKQDKTDRLWDDYGWSNTCDKCD